MVYEPIKVGEMPTLVNVAKRLDPDGSIADIAELLVQTNPIIQDIPMIEGNLPTGHRTTVRSDTPVPTWRRLNYGVRNTKSATSQVDDTIGLLEDYAEVDKKLADLNGNSAEWRLSEDTPHVEGMSNEMAQTIFYGDTSVNPDRFLGLAPRYDDMALAGKPLAVTPSAHLSNIINMDDSGSSTDLTSLWLVSWGEQTVHGIYPKGSNGGLEQQDLGEVTLKDNTGGKFQGYRTHYAWNMGLCVRDWRYIVRVANIDLLKLDDADYQILLYKAMIKAKHAMPSATKGNKVFYCGAAVSAMLDFASVEKANAALGLKEVFGEEVVTFRGVPIRQCDAILETEARVPDAV